MQFFATHPFGCSDLLERDVASVGGAIVARTTTGIGFTGELECAYRLCLWSRVANRVLLHLNAFDSPDPDSLYDGIGRTRWLDHVGEHGTIAVDFTTTRSRITHGLYGAQRVKDAIVDQLRTATGARPSVDLEAPDLRINVHLENDRASVAVDLAGGSLHRRGYRVAQGGAPLKENVAAALLLRAGWPEIAASGGALLDPMCGSGTFAIEGLLIAADIAPQLTRVRFGFERWKGHARDVWQRLLAEAVERRDAGLRRAPEIRASDHDPRAVEATLNNVAAANLTGRIVVELRALRDVKPTAPHGLLICNPPYGERLSSAAALPALFTELGEVLRARFDGWRAAVLAPDAELGFRTGLRLTKKNAARNGALEVVLLTFDVAADRVLTPRSSSEEVPRAGTPRTDSARVDARRADTTTAHPPRAPLDAGVGDFANRIRRNRRHLDRWSRRQAVSCYRVYDADLPDYAFAIDLYRAADDAGEAGARWLHVQEYAAPSSIDADRARLRRESVMAVLPELFDIAPSHVHLKTRERKRGPAQYTRQAEVGEFYVVDEGGCRLRVNLRDYLDTGLFLDHRPLRMRIQRESRGKRFLNLFAYTGAATVHAIRGGAASTTSVDLSNTYLAWALANIELNTRELRTHRLVRADCTAWLADSARRADRYDLILLDPPSFSNSKATDDVLDVQRDHVALIRASVELLASGGRLYFSTNLRTFTFDAAALGGLDCVNITAGSIDEDFRRSPRIHQCWQIERKNG